MRLPLDIQVKELVTVAVAVVVGVVVVVGGGLLMGGGYASTALVNGGPGTTPSKPLDISTDQLNRYVETELIYIGTLKPLMAENMTKDTGVSNPPPVTSTQDGSTNVIKMTVVGSTPEEAAELARSAANTYIADWTARNSADVSAEAASTKKALAEAKTELAALEAGGTCSGANETQCEQLRATVAGFEANISTAQRYVQEPSAEDSVKTTSTMSLALLGLILGAVVGVLIVYVQRRRLNAGESDGVSPGRS